MVMPVNVGSDGEKWLVAKNNNNLKKGLIIPRVLEIMWELDESLLCQSHVYIKALHLANSYNQSGEKAHLTEENQSKFNINTENTSMAAVARSSCFQTEQVLQNDVKKTLFFCLNKDKLMLGEMVFFFFATLTTASDRRIFASVYINMCLHGAKKHQHCFGNITVFK